jgi:uncharacterized protein (TIGR02145 family)
MKQLTLPALLTLLLCITFNKGSAQVTDIDGQVYKTTIINKHSWMAENLNVSHFRNGDIVPQATTREEWYQSGKDHKPAWCYYDNDSDNEETYGKLYNWYALTDARGLVPKGWHVPTDPEWTVLTTFLGKEHDIAAPKMKATSGWNDNGNGSNETGFTALPGGYCNDIGYFANMGSSGRWWTSTSFSDGAFGWYGFLYSGSSKVIRYYTNVAAGISVRCIKD